MAINLQGIGNQLRGIITRGANNTVDKYAEGVLKDLNNVGKEWQKAVRQLLSVPAVPFKRNLSLFPKMRTGGLVRSVLAPKVLSRTISKRSRGFYEEITFRFSPMFSGYSKPSIGNIGDHLNDWEGKPFSGWKNRVDVMFRASILDASGSRRQTSVKSMLDSLNKSRYKS